MGLLDRLIFGGDEALGFTRVGRAQGFGAASCLVLGVVDTTTAKHPVSVVHGNFHASQDKLRLTLRVSEQVWANPKYLLSTF